LSGSGWTDFAIADSRTVHEIGSGHWSSSHRARLVLPTGGVWDLRFTVQVNAGGGSQPAISIVDSSGNDLGSSGPEVASAFVAMSVSAMHYIAATDYVTLKLYLGTSPQTLLGWRASAFLAA
jgi:hypothetical protein